MNISAKNSIKRNTNWYTSDIRFYFFLSRGTYFSCTQDKKFRYFDPFERILSHVHVPARGKNENAIGSICICFSLHPRRGHLSGQCVVLQQGKFPITDQPMLPSGRDHKH